MSDKINDGGTAFPASKRSGTIGPPDYAEGSSGMTLRDYFAASAIDANMAEAVEWYKTVGGVDVYARTAIGCYKLADAMLAARERPTP